ncbi:unnamed protein product [Nyctereutes procyonoides]|uniref:NADH dehydrogenase [ubiquinone] 1 alpha subcomplex subunit 3 n=1 Tax=Nyctereutes procyonoides TaxID=34880 RepID=A0A811XXI6_NYCPR|nr:unnamed protein product [Nyctereutes procyonoides]
MAGWPWGFAPAQVTGLDIFLRDAWTKEPVLIVSFTPGALAIILPPLSPYTKYAIIINQATPFEVMGTCLRCPILPAPQGPSLKRLKKL